MKCKTFRRLAFTLLALTGLCLSARGELLELDVLAICTSAPIEVDTREEHVAYAALGGESVEVIGDTDITGDVTWTADKTWLVTGIVLVKGGTLTIEPGTKVLLGVGSGIRQDGGVVVSDGVAFAPMSDEKVRALASGQTVIDTRTDITHYVAAGTEVELYGEPTWTAPNEAKLYTLSHSDEFGDWTAEYKVVGDNVVVVGDTGILADATWTADKTWIVAGTVLVQGGTLTIEPGTTVLLGVGSGIRQDGGVVVSDGVAFAPMSDEKVRALASGQTDIDTRTDITHYVAAGTEVELYGEPTWTAPNEAKLYTLSHSDEFGDWTAEYKVVDDNVVVVGDIGISADATWTADKTWIVTGAVLVQGGTLTIEPGTTVLLGVGSGIRQYGGTVVADGVAFCNIAFDGRMDYAEAEKGDVRMDTDVGHLRVAATEEPIAFSSLWGESAAAQVKVSYSMAYGDNADVVSEAGPTEGEYIWQAEKPGYYSFSHVAGDETLTAEFVVPDYNEIELVLNGEISESTDWSKDKVILIDGILTVKSGAVLTIAPGAIVKFMDGAGIVCEAGGRCVADGVIFTHVNDDTVGGDTLLDGSTSPLTDMYVLNGVSGNDATQYRYHPDPTVTLSGTISKNEVWRGFNIYHVTGNITVPNGVTLTIEPGAIIKFDTGLSLTVNSGATLNAVGTRAEPIVFTSIKDDEYGGDTNGDGGYSWPYPGEWTKIGINGGMANFEHVYILYSSRNETTGAINMNGGSVVFNNGEIAHCAYDAVGVESGNFYMTNSIIHDCLLAFRHWARDPIVNCVIYDCGRLTQGGGQHFYNCIFSRITETWEAFGFPQNGTTYNNCCFWNEGGSVLTGEGTQDAMTVCGKNGNVWGDPLFVDPDNGDFRIMEKSPCVDIADNAYAPGIDYFGQPRVNAPDIGICEVMPRNATSDIDLIPQNITADAEAVSGQLLTIKWEVVNKGGAVVVDPWRDTVSLVSANGREVVLGEKVSTKRLVAGGTISCSAVFTVPAIAEGAWYPKVNVNSSHEVFEGALGDNNALTGETAVNVSINSIAASDSAPKVVPSSSSVIYRIDGLPSGGGALVISGDLASLTFAGVTGTNVLVSGTSMAGVSLPDGRMILPFASGTDMQYLTVANSSDHTAEFTVAVVEDALQVLSLSQMTVSNRGKTTIDIYGIGLSNVTSVALSGNGHRYSATTFDIKSATEMYANFDANGWEAGTYSLVVEKDGGSSQIDNVVLFQNGIGPKVTVSIEKPDAVRMGRWYTAKITCTNEGDEDAHAPIVTLMGSSETFLNPDDGISEKKGSIRLFLLSHTGNPLVLKAGQEVSVSVQFKSMASANSFTLASQCFVFGMDSIPWSNIFKFSDSSARMFERAKEVYGETTDQFFYSIFDAVKSLVEFGHYPICADDYYEAFFSLRKIRPVFGFVVDKADGKYITEGVVRMICRGVGTRFGRIDDKGRFCIWGFEENDQGDVNYSLVDNYNPLSVLDVNTDSDKTVIALAAQIGIPIGSDAVIDIAELTGNIASILLIGRNESGSPVLAMLTIDGDIYIAEVSDRIISPRIRLQREEGVLYSKMCLLKDDDGVEYLVVDAVNGSDAKIYRFRIKGDSVDDVNMAHGTKVGMLGDYFVCSNGIGKVYSNDGEILLHKAYTFETLKSGKQLKSFRPGDYYDRNFSIGGNRYFSASANIHMSSSINKQACCLWNMKGDASLTASANICGAGIEIPISVNSDMNVTCDGEEKCSGKAEVIKDGRITAYGAFDVAFPIPRVETLMEKVDKAIANSMYNVLHIPSGVSEYFRLYHSSPSLTGGCGFRYTEDVGYNDESVSKDYDVDIKGRASYTIGLGPGVSIPDVVNVSWTTTMGSVALEYGLEIGTSGVKIGAGSVSVTWGTMKGEMSFTYVPLIYYEDSGFHWYDMSGIHDNSKGVRKASDEGTTKQRSVQDEVVIDPGETIGDLKMSNCNPVWLNGTSGGFVIWEKEEKHNESFLRVAKCAHYDLSSGVVSEQLSLFGEKACLCKTGVDLDATRGIVVGVLRDNVDSFYSVIIDSRGISTPVKMGDCDGLIVDMKLNKHNNGVVLSYLKILESGGQLCIRKYDGNWGDEIILVNEKGDFYSQVSIQYIDDEVWCCYKQGDTWYFAKEKGELFNLRFPSDSLRSDPCENQAIANIRNGDSLRLLQSSKGLPKNDGCEDDCQCGCGFHFACGCPDTCLCEGHCSETDECCTCKDKKGVQIHKSKDPNEMIGPLGLGNPETERFVKPGEELTYTIYFENASNATAAAQEVYVTNPLSEWLDWSTFEMGEVAFGNQIDLGLSGKKGGTCEATMKGTNFVVRTTLAIEPTEGAARSVIAPYQAKWYMRIVDPTTDTGWPKDVLAGFLPPNDETFRGEGHLTYRIKVRDDAPAGIVITNKASIVFDYNDPIETDPSWWNTVATIYKPEIDLGNGTTTNLTLVVGEPFGPLPTPLPRDGATFGGWFTGPDGTGTRVSAESIVPAGLTGLYAYWIPVVVPPPVVPQPAPVSPETPATGAAACRVSAEPTEAWTATKAATLNGVVCDGDCNVAGVVQLKIAKPKAKNGATTAKVTGYVMLMDGKKKSLKGVTATVPGDGPIPVTAAVKGLGTLTAKIGGDGFSGTVGAYTVRTATVGGNWTKGGAAVRVDFAGGSALPAGTLEALLPVAEPIAAKGGKWTFGKAAAVKLKNGVLSGTDDPKKPNLSGMKLTYTPKTGMFKGSFKMYANQGGKLKKTTVSVNGFVVEGVGHGKATTKKPAAEWNVRVE